MSIVDQVQSQEERLKAIEERLPKPKEKKWGFRLPNMPGGIRRKAEKKPDMAAALIIGNNRRAYWEIATHKDGLWIVGKDKDKQQYGYEESAVFFLKKTPVIVLFEWRILPAGGKADQLTTRVLGGESDVEAAEVLGIKSFGQQTIVRAIEQAEIEKDTKKGGSGAILWILLGGGVGVYLLMKMFGGG